LAEQEFHLGIEGVGVVRLLRGQALRWGGISAGTLASGMGQWEEAAASAERRRMVEDPYALSPDRAAEPDLGDERDLDWVSYDSDLGRWVGLRP